MDSEDYTLLAFLEPEVVYDPESPTGQATIPVLYVEDEETWARYEAGELPHWSETKNCPEDVRWRPVRCDHCGARYTYAVWYLHKRTQEVIAVGRQCSANRFGAEDWTLKASRIAARLSREKILVDLEAALPEVFRYIEKATRIYPSRWVKDDFKEHPSDPDYYVSLDSFPTGQPTKTYADVPKIALGILSAEASLFGAFKKSIREKVLDVEKLSAAYAKLQTAYERMVVKINADLLKPKAEVPEGRVVIRGKVLSTKSVETDFGFTEKMTVEDDRGFRVFGSVPSGLKYDEAGNWVGELKGRSVEFSAAVERSERDPFFGFYKRPTKPRVLPVESAA